MVHRLSQLRRHRPGLIGAVWKPEVGNDLLLEVASGWAGERITELEALAEGEDSRAVAFTSARAGRVVLRLRRDGSGFPREVQARKLLAPVGVNVPEVLEIGTVGDLAWCISARIEGSTLQELTPSEARAVGPALVETWRAMASVRRPVETSGVGAFDDRPAPSWESFLDAQDDEVDDAADELAALLGHELVDKARRVLAVRPADLDEGRLVHFDFGSNNVLVAGGRIVAVLDWDYPGWGDPLWDVANLHAWRAWLPCMDIHALCFDEHLAALPSYRERIRHYGTHIVLGALRWELFVDGDPRVRAALRAGLARLVG